MTYGHALHLLARCACGAIASFRYDSGPREGEPCCKKCYTS